MPADKLLLISCYFPPAGGIQVLRALSLAKYLPQNQFEVHVLTTRNPAVPTYDEALLDQIPSAVRIHRAWTLEPPFFLRKKLWSRIKGKNARTDSSGTTNSAAGGLKYRLAARVTRLLSPDPQVLWRPFAFRKAASLIEREKINFVLVTAPPFSAFLIGNALKLRYPHIHLISEVRDEWLNYFLNEFAFRGDDFVRTQAREIERNTVELSDRVVTVTQATRDAMRARYSDQPDEKFGLIFNGYDAAEFESFRSRPHGTDKIVVAHLGTVYRPTSPAAYLDALDSLPEEIRSRFETRFIGRIAEEFDRSLLTHRKSSTKFIGFVPHGEAVRHMEESDYLLLPWADRFNVPGKLYEYLASGKPVIGLVPPRSDADRILRESGSALLADGSDIGQIRQVLRRSADPATAAALRPDREAIQRYERSRLTAEYAGLIRSCVAARQVPNTIVGVR
ncbi:MAG: glycosyltransferase [Bryobacteraceae bacterium]|jgi:glycosyltransferase involved in cell wall biosynthesis